jgi:hypothetical protein
MENLAVGGAQRARVRAMVRVGMAVLGTGFDNYCEMATPAPSRRLAAGPAPNFYVNYVGVTGRSGMVNQRPPNCSMVKNVAARDLVALVAGIRNGGTMANNRDWDFGAYGCGNWSAAANAATRGMKKRHCQGRRREPALTSPARRAWNPGAPVDRARSAEATIVREIMGHHEQGSFYKVVEDMSVLESRGKGGACSGHALVQLREDVRIVVMINTTNGIMEMIAIFGPADPPRHAQELWVAATLVTMQTTDADAGPAYEVRRTTTRTWTCRATRTSSWKQNAGWTWRRRGVVWRTCESDW